MLSLRLATRACGQREPFSDEASVRTSRCQWGWACHPCAHLLAPSTWVRREGDRKFLETDLPKRCSTQRARDPKHGGRYRMDEVEADTTCETQAVNRQKVGERRILPASASNCDMTLRVTGLVSAYGVVSIVYSG